MPIGYDGNFEPTWNGRVFFWAYAARYDFIYLCVICCAYSLTKNKNFNGYEKEKSVSSLIVIGNEQKKRICGNKTSVELFFILLTYSDHQSLFAANSVLRPLGIAYYGLVYET